MKEVQRGNKEARMGTLMGVFAAGRGGGAVVSGPLSEVLLARGRLKGGSGEKRFGFGTEYGVLIVFTGVSALFGLICFGSKKEKKVEELKEESVDV